MPQATGAPRRARVVTVSDRCSRGERQDESGPVAEAWLTDRGLSVDRVVVPDGVESVAGALRDAAAAGMTFVLTTGGTGLGPRDLTPEGTLSVVDRVVPGLAEALRADGARHTPMAVLSRGTAGIINPGTLVVNLPGSPRAVREGCAVLDPLLEHIVGQLAGGDH